MASMGIYALRYDAMDDMLEPERGTDFGNHVIPWAITHCRVFGFPFADYWEDIGTIRSYYDANLALTDDRPKFELFNPQMKLFTHPRFLPGARLGDSHIRHSLLCAGARAEEVRVDRSIVGLRAALKSGVTIGDSVICGADFYESEESLAENRELQRPDVGIGGDTFIRRAIVDKNARIGYGVVIDPGENAPDSDGDGYAVRDGIVIIEKSAVIPDGSRIPERK